MARPSKPSAPVCYKPSLRLYPGEDDDLIAYLKQEQAKGGSLAQAIILAMRGGMKEMNTEEDGDDADRAQTLFDNLFFE